MTAVQPVEPAPVDTALVELVSAQLPAAEAGQVLEVAGHDRMLFVVELLALYQTGRLTLPSNVVRMLKRELAAPH